MNHLQNIASPGRRGSKAPRVLAFFLSYLLATFPTLPGTAQAQTDFTPADLRVELSAMVDRLLAAKSAPQLDAAAIEALGEVQWQLSKASGADLDGLEALAPSVARMNKAFDLLSTVEELRVRRVKKAESLPFGPTSGTARGFEKSTGFPEAAYPNLINDIEETADVLADTFSNPLDDCCLVKLLVEELSDAIDVDVEAAIEAFTFGALDICDNSCDFTATGETNSVTDFGECDAVNRSTTLEAYATRTAFIIVEAARDVASRICGQSLGVVVAGGNASLLCIPMDFIYIVAKSLHDNLGMCDDFIDEAEIDGSYERLEHIHGDLETAQASLDDLDGDLVAHDTALAEHGARILEKIADNDSSTTSEVDGVEATILSAIETHDLDVASLLAAQRAFFTHLEIEEALLKQESEGIYYLPQASGGSLELVRAVVIDTIAAVTASGESVHEANTQLAGADYLISAGFYKKAFDALGAAYFEAIKRPGEQQVPTSSLP